MHIVALSHDRTNHSLRRFRATAVEMGHKFSRIDPIECDLMLGPGTRGIHYQGRPFPKTDVALVRRGSGIQDLEITVVNHLENTGVPVLNGTYGLLTSRDKFWGLRRLADRGIPVPRTVVLHDPKHIKQAIKLIGEPPVVIKLLRGMRGVGVMIADSMNSLRSIAETFHSKGERILLQEYIEESKGSDVRVLVVGGKVVAAMKRQADVGEFRSNIHRGGTGTLFKLDAKSKRMAVDAARIIGLDIAGVDLIYSDHGPLVMEVNSSPGFEGLEKATGQDIARIIMEHSIALAEGRAKTMARKLRLVEAPEVGKGVVGPRH
ncbi:MAG: RimK family alpha-L-glutamate ligase [Euryarchaeota archaeon]|nr:RimK family alpha-L-glutamate ligase [Euryarchaeota archaeon]